MPYNTVGKEGFGEQIIEKSRFLAYIKPVLEREEALEYFDAVKRMHKDATHHVPAMVIGEQYQIQWASDDGEPQGTAGAPLVHMLVKEQVTNVALVVVRYFGGIKLGPGGLIRAYTSSAKMALESAGIREVRDMVELTVAFAYPYLQKFENMSLDNQFSIESCDYSDTVTATILFPMVEKQRIKNKLFDLTSGSIKIILEVSKNA